MITQDKVLDGTAIGYLMECNEDFGPRLRQPIRTRDGKTYDTSGAYLVGQLERYDQTAHPPLSSVTWDRDLPIRDDVTYGDEEGELHAADIQHAWWPWNGIEDWAEAFRDWKVDHSDCRGCGRRQLGEAAPHHLGGGSFLHASRTRIVPSDWPPDRSAEVGCARLGIPAPDRCAGVSRVGRKRYLGLINSPKVATTNLPNGAANGSRWMPRTGYLGKTPAEILADLGNMVYAPWAASAFSVKPNRLLLDPQNFNYIRTVPASAAGSKSILQYFLESQNSDPSESDPLRVLPLKWLTDSGAGNEPMGGSGINRSVAYNKSETFPYVRFPLTMLQRTPLEYTAMSQRFYKWGKLGACEFIYPETVAYFDGN